VIQPLYALSRIFEVVSDPMASQRIGNETQVGQGLGSLRVSGSGFVLLLHNRQSRDLECSILRHHLPSTVTTFGSIHFDGLFRTDTERVQNGEM